MAERAANPRNRIVASAVLLAVVAAVVWYQRSHPGPGKGDSGKKAFLSQAPSSEGSGRFAWVPPYPGATVSGIRTKMTHGELSYGFEFRTPDPSGKVLSFYQNHLQEAGFKVDLRNTGQLHAEDPGGKRVLDMTAAAVKDGTETGVLAVEK